MFLARLNFDFEGYCDDHNEEANKGEDGKTHCEGWR
jgi:hypothetical protein